MGPLRGGLILSLLAAPAFAEVCDKERPDWDGVPVTIFQETLMLFMSPACLLLLAVSVIAVRFKSQWGALIAVVLWTGFVSLLTMADPTGLRAPAMAEGCIGSPALFIGTVAAICIAMILYTAPLTGRTSPSEND